MIKDSYVLTPSDVTNLGTFHNPLNVKNAVDLFYDNIEVYCNLCCSPKFDWNRKNTAFAVVLLIKLDEYMCISNEINNEGNIVSESSINASTIGNNNNNSINVYVQNNSNGFSRNEIHDIEVLERILSCVPKRFNERLETLLLCNRRYKCDELDYVHEINDKVKDTNNYLINNELRILAEKMGEAFSDLGWKIAGRFAPVCTCKR